MNETIIPDVPAYVYIGMTDTYPTLLKIGKADTVATRAKSWGIQILGTQICRNAAEAFALETATIKFLELFGLQHGAQSREWFVLNPSLGMFIVSTFEFHSAAQCFEIFSPNGTLQGIERLAPESFKYIRQALGSAAGELLGD